MASCSRRRKWCDILFFFRFVVGYHRAACLLDVHNRVEITRNNYGVDVHYSTCRGCSSYHATHGTVYWVRLLVFLNPISTELQLHCSTPHTSCMRTAIAILVLSRATLFAARCVPNTLSIPSVFEHLSLSLFIDRSTTGPKNGQMLAQRVAEVSNTTLAKPHCVNWRGGCHPTWRGNV